MFSQNIYIFILLHPAWTEKGRDELSQGMLSCSEQEAACP